MDSLWTRWALGCAVAIFGLACSDDEASAPGDGGTGGTASCGNSPGAKCCETVPKCGPGLACNSANVCEGCGAPGELCCNGACTALDHACSGGRCVPCGNRGEPCCNATCASQLTRCCAGQGESQTCDPGGDDGVCKVCCALCSDGKSSSVDLGAGECMTAAQQKCAASTTCADAGPCELSDWGWRTSCQ